MMTPDAAKLLDRLRVLCQDLPEAEEYVMVHHPAFRVRKKPFAIVGDEGTLAVKVPKEAQAAFLEADPRFFRSPYIGQHGWVTLRLSEPHTDAEIVGLVTASWRGVAPRSLLR